jgi:hypothetical protein
VGPVAGEFDGSPVANAAIGSRDESCFAKEGRNLRWGPVIGHLVLC